MNLIKPEKLKKGDTLAIIAPAGKVETELINKAVCYFTSMGYKVKTGSNLNKTWRYMAGSDEERLEDLHNAFLDNEVNAVICARGGFGAIRLVNKIDYEIIKRNPKIFCGYSDITALSAMLLKNAGLITFSGPMAQSDFSVDDIDSFSEQSFFKTLSDSQVDICADNLKIYKEGSVSGILFGGNLATIASLCGCDFVPDEEFIFFTEDLNEDVYKIDKYFRQLLNIEKFKNNISGIVLGEFLNVDNNEYLDELFYELSFELDIPVYSGYPVTHSKRKVTVPYGARATLTNGVIHCEY